MELDSIRNEFDVVVIGAGPAGMACATVLAREGLTVLMADEQSAMGGQIYRNIEQASWNGIASALGEDYQKGLKLVTDCVASSATHLSGATVWNIGQNQEMWISKGGRSRLFRARSIVLATGAMERPVPVPGWTLPGVMTVGAIQIMLKNGFVPQGQSVIFVGTGPLFYLTIKQCLDAGIPAGAILDTAKSSNLFRAAAWLPAALNREGLSQVVKGLSLIRRVKSSGARFFSNVADVRISANGEARTVHFSSGGAERSVEGNVVALHEGVIPSQQMGRLIGCDHRWDERQVAFLPVVSEWGETTRPNIYISGDAAGIGGAVTAELRGRLSAFAILEKLGVWNKTTRDDAAVPIRRLVNRNASIRPLLETLYFPPSEIGKPMGDTIVCRCESVAASTISDLAEQKLGPNQIKALTRCGMGKCQGRICGPVVSSIIAKSQKIEANDVGYYGVRPPIKPISVGELSDVK
jgi:thioredoxin reductase